MLALFGNSDAAGQVTFLLQMWGHSGMQCRLLIDFKLKNISMLRVVKRMQVVDVTTVYIEMLTITIKTIHFLPLFFF